MFSTKIKNTTTKKICRNVLKKNITTIEDFYSMVYNMPDIFTEIADNTIQDIFLKKKLEISNMTIGINDKIMTGIPSRTMNKSYITAVENMLKGNIIRYTETTIPFDIHIRPISESIIPQNTQRNLAVLESYKESSIKYFENVSGEHFQHDNLKDPIKSIALLANNFEYGFSKKIFGEYVLELLDNLDTSISITISNSIPVFDAKISELHTEIEFLKQAKVKLTKYCDTNLVNTNEFNMRKKQKCLDYIAKICPSFHCQSDISPEVFGLLFASINGMIHHLEKEKDKIIEKKNVYCYLSTCDLGVFDSDKLNIPEYLEKIVDYLQYFDRYENMQDTAAKNIKKKGLVVNKFTIFDESRDNYYIQIVLLN